jgi:hypothetical protein
MRRASKRGDVGGMENVAYVCLRSWGPRYSRLAAPSAGLMALAEVVKVEMTTSGAPGEGAPRSEVSRPGGYSLPVLALPPAGRDLRR